MPLVSIDQCIPVLQREIKRLDTLVGDHLEGGYNEAQAQALWGHLIDVIVQAQNVAGPPPRPLADHLLAMLRRAGQVAP